MPCVSVIIPCFRQAQFLPSAIASLQSQTLVDWEAIIIDDGSPDNTRQVATEWASRDARVRYHHQANGGLSNARNAGLALATGEFIQFLDADDVLLPDKLYLQVRKLSDDSNPADLCIGDYYAANVETPLVRIEYYVPPFPKGISLLESVIKDWECSISIPVHCYLLRRDFLSSHGVRFDESLPNHEDWDFLVRLLVCNPHVTFDQNAQAVYCQHASSMCRDIKKPRDIEKLRDGFLRAIENNLSRPLPRGLDALLREKRTDVLNRYNLWIQKDRESHRQRQRQRSPLRRLFLFTRRAMLYVLRKCGLQRR
jgi:glycosyltransferase involved in cell wall biosynthesis